MFDKNTIIAFFLIALIMIFMPYYQKHYLEKEAAPADPGHTLVSNKDKPEPESISEMPVYLPPEGETALAPVLTGVEKQLVFSTKHYYLTLSNKGGGTVTQLRFKDYLKYNGNYVRLLKDDASANLGLEFPVTSQENLSFNDIPFYGDLYEKHNHLDTIVVTDPVEFLLVLKTENDKVIERTFTLYPEGYAFDLHVTLKNFHNLVPEMTYTINWYDGFDFSERNIQDDLNYSYVYGKVGTELINLQLKDKPQSIRTDGDARWTAVRSKYFLASVVATSKDGLRAGIEGWKTKTDRFFNTSLFMRLSSEPIHHDSFRIILAPLDEEYLTSLGYGHEHVMNWGWKLIKPISIGILRLLKFMRSFIPNYGVVLLIFSFLIKILLYPLTHKSYESMKKMQELQPLMAELKEKHSKNPQALNQETMKLYKEYGVNPLGGCLPMLLQMPLLYALFIVFRTTIELRGAFFVWWIKDLSSPDVILTLPFSIPLYGDGVAVLPIMMALTMIFQQKMSGASQVNQQQKMMMWFMPLFFLLIFNNFPSGLNLYYTLFNLLTIIQQKYFINPSVHAKLSVQKEKTGKQKKN